MFVQHTEGINLVCLRRGNRHRHRCGSIKYNMRCRADGWWKILMPRLYPCARAVVQKLIIVLYVYDLIICHKATPHRTPSMHVMFCSVESQHREKIIHSGEDLNTRPTILQLLLLPLYNALLHVCSHTTSVRKR